ncbi:MAG TPA: hypothetical protein VH253_01110 [Phycisphaerae bacterium]|nr:hypothetical protein [Phycisphaerae bacterium]
MVAPAEGHEAARELGHAVKVLDLLTNRYHVGLLEAAWEAGMRVELPATARFQAGQRVRFVVAGGEGVVSKGSMKRATVSGMSGGGVAERVRVELVVGP